MIRIGSWNLVYGITMKNKWTHIFSFQSDLKRPRVRVAEWLALPTSDHEVAGSNPAVGKILPEPKRHFIAQSLSCSPFHHLEMTEILLKGRKTLTHPSISRTCHWRDAYAPSSTLLDFRIVNLVNKISGELLELGSRCLAYRLCPRCIDDLINFWQNIVNMWLNYLPFPTFV